MRKFIIAPLLLLAGALFAQKENPDMAMMAKIRDEGLNHSQVMEIIFNLTDASGPRLMQSPGYFKAANWAKAKLTSWGLENANLEAWGNWAGESPENAGANASRAASPRVDRRFIGKSPRNLTQYESELTTSPRAFVAIAQKV